MVYRSAPLLAPVGYPCRTPHMVSHMVSQIDPQFMAESYDPPNPNFCNLELGLSRTTQRVQRRPIVVMSSGRNMSLKGNIFSTFSHRILHCFNNDIFLATAPAIIVNSLLSTMSLIDHNYGATLCVHQQYRRRCCALSCRKSKNNQ